MRFTTLDLKSIKRNEIVGNFFWLIVILCGSDRVLHFVPDVSRTEGDRLAFPFEIKGRSVTTDRLQEKRVFKKQIITFYFE